MKKPIDPRPYVLGGCYVPEDDSETPDPKKSKKSKRGPFLARKRTRRGAEMFALASVVVASIALAVVLVSEFSSDDPRDPQGRWL